LCAKLSKCDTTLFPEDNIKIYDASKSTAVFSTITLMSVPIFMDLQDFFVGRQFVVKEFAALKGGFELSHYIFGCSESWNNLTKAERPGDVAD